MAGRRVTQALGTSHPTMTDIALRGYGQDVLDTLERGGTASIWPARGRAHSLSARSPTWRPRQAWACRSLDVDEGGFIYRLAPLGEGVEQYPQLAAFDERFPGKTSSAFKGGAGIPRRSLHPQPGSVAGQPAATSGT